MIIKFIKEVPKIVVNNDFEIETVQHLDEDEDRVILRVAQYVPQFVKGFICDMEFEFLLIDKDFNKNDDSLYTHAKDLVLVTIRKTSDIGSLTQFEYVFYKS